MGLLGKVCSEVTRTEYFSKMLKTQQVRRMGFVIQGMGRKGISRKFKGSE